MLPEDLPDDFSQLPTADEGPQSSPQRKTPAPARRQQTRIGPQTSGLPQSPPQGEASQVSEEWSELIHNASQQEPEPIYSAPAQSWQTIESEEILQEHLSDNSPASSSELAPESESSPPHEARRKEDVHREAHADTSQPSRKERPATALDTNAAAEPAVVQETETTTPSLPPLVPLPAPASMSPTTGRGNIWERWGGKALAVSVVIHVLLLVGGATYVIQQAMAPEQVDFLPGGGTPQGQAASQALEHKIQQKKTPWLKKAMPMQKIGVANSVSDIILPDDVPDLMNLPDSGDLLRSKLSGSMGLAGTGSAPKAMGLGSQTGMVFQPFSLFGMQIKSKQLGLVLDVSTSMAPHLPRVIEEVDKVAKGSVVILYFGCGLIAPPIRGIDGDEVYSTGGSEFERFWRLGGVSLEESRKARVDTKQPIPSEEIYRLLARRSQTYFIHSAGIGYTWLALLSDKLRSADGIYWFSDFQDTVDFKQLTIVRENLLRRKQRLYMHAYERGPSFDLIKTQLVDPTRGDSVIEE